MKNIHIIPTDKPSKLRYFCGKLERMYAVPKKSDIVFQNIYITSDEEIKEGGYVFWEGKIYKYRDFMKMRTPVYTDYFSIILTTDQDLIKDGVQAIDDKFLEWFVNNSSCKEVKTKLVEFEVDMGLGDSCVEYGSYYKIIIPKEEPDIISNWLEQNRNPEIDKQVDDEAKKLQKQHLIDKMKQEPKQENCCTPIGQIKRYVDCKGCDKKPKQETLEEATERLIKLNRQDAFYEGAKWQQNRSYSEEDIENIWNEFVKELPPVNNGASSDFLVYLKQFKKNNMKKLLLSVIIVMAMSCSSNNDSSSSDTPALDCNCDRVVEANTFNVVGTPESPAINYYTVYTTINDCTGIQRQKNHTSTSYPSRPQLGQCR